MARGRIRLGNNIPVQCPLIPDPFVPYHCPGNRTLYAVCRGARATQARYLKPTPFEPVGDLFLVAVSDFSNCDKVAYMDAAVVLPIAYKGQPGGNYLFEYENDDRAIAAGRDLWGYPKKYAAITMSPTAKRVRAAAVRHGTAILALEVDLSKPVADLPQLKVTPHFNFHVLPRAEGPGWREARVIERDTSPDFELLSHKTGRARVTLKSLPGDPLGEMAPFVVLGGGLVVGNFHAQGKNGWGRVRETIRNGRALRG